MTNLLNEMKKITVLEQAVTIRSTVKPETESQLQALGRSYSEGIMDASTGNLTAAGYASEK